MLIYLNSVRIVGVALCGCECGLGLCAHSIFAAFQRLAVYRELLILNDFVFHSLKGGAKVDGAGGRGREQEAKRAGCHFCPAGNLWNRFIMFAYNYGPSRDTPQKRRRAMSRRKQAAGRAVGEGEQERAAPSRREH